MKKLIRTAAMVALLFVTAKSTANKDKLSLESKKESKSLVFEMDANKSSVVKLYDENQNVIYYENIITSSYSKRFNLESLSNGNYYFVSEDAQKMITYTILVRDNDAKIIEKKEHFKPVFRTEGHKVFLNLLNLGKEAVSIKVYDSNNRLVFSEKTANEMIVEKAMNFEQAFKDVYTVVVKAGTNEYFEEIFVN